MREKLCPVSRTEMGTSVGKLSVDSLGDNGGIDGSQSQGKVVRFGIHFKDWIKWIFRGAGDSVRLKERNRD